MTVAELQQPRKIERAAVTLVIDRALNAAMSS